MFEFGQVKNRHEKADNSCTFCIVKQKTWNNISMKIDANCIFKYQELYPAIYRVTGSHNIKVIQYVL